MLRRATIGLKWVALIALIVGAFTYAVAGGGGSGGYDCVNHWHRLSWTSTCTPVGSSSCHGGCFELRWLERNCIPGTGTCTATTMTVNRVMYRADCDIRIGPVCDCNTNWQALFVWDSITVPWCY